MYPIPNKNITSLILISKITNTFDILRKLRARNVTIYKEYITITVDVLSDELISFY